MATSQNGWTVHTSSAPLVPLKWVTGRVVAGDVHKIFDYLCQRFDAEVEPIIVAHSWGYAYRAVRGQTSGYSNHASGTAIDLNAPAHPLGKRGTFSDKQVAAIRRILADLDGVVHWGGDYQNRPDEMHFEINANAARVAAVAKRLGQPAKPPKKTPLLTAFRLAPTVALRVAAARRIVRRGSKVLRADAQAYIDARAEVAAARKRRTTQVKAARKKATAQIQAATKRAKAARRRLLSKEVQ